ncbi:hypothetical protein [Proteiniborus ethanoligenes]|uniref:hypothetical protein n=1 Tax=Proteiniborus ethanoligenes TaxID=415015 RepID=UPI00115F906C|nr:hypothetical protein [Proteiniborus ethanoligenes]
MEANLLSPYYISLRAINKINKKILNFQYISDIYYKKTKDVLIKARQQFIDLRENLRYFSIF